MNEGLVEDEHGFGDLGAGWNESHGARA